MFQVSHFDVNYLELVCVCVCVKRGHVNSNGVVSTEMGPLRKDRYHISFYIDHGT